MTRKLPPGTYPIGAFVQTADGTGEVVNHGSVRNLRRPQGVNYRIRWHDRPGVPETWVWHSEILAAASSVPL